jgi:hypothetical protein
MQNQYFEDETVRPPFFNHQIWGKTVKTEYLCAGCGEFEYLFFIEFVTTDISKSGDYIGFVRKVGQTPPWEISMDRELEKILGEDAEIYKKGLACESQSYGIGAYAYFRRIVEKIIDNLLSQIPELIEDQQDKEKYLLALEKTKKEKNTEAKIELVKDLLPKSLTPDNLNPLEIIYSSLSEGIHEKNDDECLEIVAEIKTSLTFLLKEVSSKRADKKTFTENIRKLLDKKASK